MRYLLTLTLLFVNSVVALSQRYAPLRVVKDSISFLSVSKLTEDLDEYAKGIAHNHISPFTVVKRRTFFDEVDKIKDTAKYLNTDELLVRMMRVNAKIEDEHTNICYVSRDIFPYRCYWFDEGIYIDAAEDSNDKFIDCKIIAVNNQPIDSVVAALAGLSTSQNLPGIKKSVQHNIFDPFIIHGLSIAPARTEVFYTVVAVNGDTMQLHPVAKDKRSIKFRFKHGHDFKRFSRAGTYWFTYEPKENYLYFRYLACHDESKDNLFKDFEKKLEAEIDAKKPAKLIIDLRDNGGGYPGLLSSFIRYLNTSYLNKKGHIYVLIGRRTFSAAIINSVSLKQLTYAQLVGEETSGSTAFYGGVQWFTLPASGLMVSYSTHYVATDVKYSGSLRPDIAIPNTFADYINDKDATLEYAIYH